MSKTRKCGPVSRDALKQYLIRASALEQQLLSAYLYTAYSLKQDMSEGGISSPAEMGATLSWKGMITGVAVQEMLHLALASNMLTAVGGTPLFSPYVGLPNNETLDLNFPIGPSKMKAAWGYDNGAWLGLWPFSEQTIETFVWFESYEEEPTFPGPPWKEDTSKVEAMQGLQVSNLVELYMSIAECFLQLESQDPGNLFVGNPNLQVTNEEVTALFDFPPVTVNNGADQVPALRGVFDVPTALIAINTIIVQGEGDTEEWQAYLAEKQQEYPSLFPDQFPVISSPSHHVIFSQVLNGVPAAPPKPAVPGYLQLKQENPDFDPVRPVAQNVLASDPCQGNPPCEANVNPITDPFTKSLAEFTDNLFVAMMDALNLGFTLPADPNNPDSAYTYAKGTLVQSAIRAMSYLLAPVANALTQISGGSGFNAGPGFIYPPDHQPATWDSLVQAYQDLSTQASELASQAPDVTIWLSPSYIGIPPKGSAYPQSTLQDLLQGKLAPDLAFMADRLSRVEGHAPPVDPNTGDLYPLHVCQGLNSCAGQDITGEATAAGNGVCATADPHVCSGQNHCAGQGGCGFTPSPTTTPDLQNHPGENQVAGLTLQRGFWLPNPQTDPPPDSACGAPILPSLQNTYGLNTPPADDRGGSDEVYGEAEGYVWDFARVLFEQKMEKQGVTVEPTDFTSYRGNGST